MYTDGLVERPDRPFAEGIDRAIEVLSHESTTLTTGEYIDALVAALIGDRHDNDDVAIVVVKNVS
jgi:serine phosphatase RsbU (regulator of sigma subunit)